MLLLLSDEVPATGNLFPDFAPNPALRHQFLSGIEISQNSLTYSAPMQTLVYQTFRLPSNYQRAGTDIPDISGLQVCCNTLATDLSLDISLDVNEFGNWVPLAQGAIRGSAANDEKEWINAYFNAPITVNPEWLERQFRIGVRSSSPIWYSYPPPLFGETATIAGGQLAFKLMTMTADDGTDFLGNRYRSIVKIAAVDKTTTVATANSNTFWQSQPNPSKYAVESLYFDVSDFDRATVVDRVLVDPITPGVYFTVYYSSDGEPGVTDTDWETKLWTPIYKTFRMDRREEHALPEPVTARYMKVEFTHLQAMAYSPGTFSQPIRYRKHPKWVLDYFLARLNTSEDPFVARQVKVVYDSLKIGYDYYLDDLHQKPADPNTVSTTNLISFLSDRSDVSDQIDPTTLGLLKVAMRPYTSQPANRTNEVDYLLAGSLVKTANYPTEILNPATADTTQVSQLNRSSLVYEGDYPVMFFYIPSRHTYRVLEASFQEDRAYFVGVRELAFTRDHYTVASDTDTYVENLTDFTNALRNDFVSDDFVPFKPNPGP